MSTDLEALLETSKVDVVLAREEQEQEQEEAPTLAKPERIVHKIADIESDRTFVFGSVIEWTSDEGVELTQCRVWTNDEVGNQTFDGAVFLLNRNADATSKNPYDTNEYPVYHLSPEYALSQAISAHDARQAMSQEERSPADMIQVELPKLKSQAAQVVAQWRREQAHSEQENALNAEAMNALRLVLRGLHHSDELRAQLRQLLANAD